MYHEEYFRQSIVGVVLLIEEQGKILYFVYLVLQLLMREILPF
jgi:hypothetical protein